MSEVLAAVIKVDPDWSGLPADTPPAIRRLLRHCLEKDRRERLHDIGDARIDIRDVSQATDADGSQVGATTPRNRERLAWSVAALLFIVACGAAAIAVFQPAPNDAPALRASILLPAPLGPAAPDARLALSPDGRRLAFVAPGPDGRRMLWVRPLDSLVAQPLDGTDGAGSPFWSPDSRIIAFFADRRLKSGASRPAALLLAHIVPLGSLVAPCRPGAALRDFCHESR